MTYKLYYSTIKNHYINFINKLLLTKDIWIIVILISFTLISIFSVASYVKQLSVVKTEILLLKSELLNTNNKLDNLIALIESNNLKEKSANTKAVGIDLIKKTSGDDKGVDVSSSILSYYDSLVNNNLFIYSCYFVMGLVVIYAGYTFINHMQNSPSNSSVNFIDKNFDLDVNVPTNYIDIPKNSLYTQNIIPENVMRSDIICKHLKTSGNRQNIDVDLDYTNVPSMSNINFNVPIVSPRELIRDLQNKIANGEINGSDICTVVSDGKSTYFIPKDIFPDMPIDQPISIVLD